MRTLKLSTLSLAIASLCLSGSLMANTPIPVSPLIHGGLYVSGGMGYAHTWRSGKFIHGNAKLFSVEYYPRNYTVAVGYKFTDHVGMRFGMTKLMAMRFINRHDENIHQKITAYSLTANGYFPIKKIDLLAGIGLAKLNAAQEVNGKVGAEKRSIVPVFSFGGQYQLTRTVSVGLNYTLIAGHKDVGKFGTLQASLQIYV